MYAELNERAEPATGSYSVTGHSLRYIYSLLVTKNHRNIRPRCLVHEFFFTDINHGYRAAILKKYSLWLLPLYMFVATYFYYEKVRRTMRTTIVSNLLNLIWYIDIQLNFGRSQWEVNQNFLITSYFKYANKSLFNYLASNETNS